MASRIVDFPLPFSPTRKVTGFVSFRFKHEIAGIEKGNPVPGKFGFKEIL
jgi:hypothetical protein